MGISLSARSSEPLFKIKIKIPIVNNWGRFSKGGGNFSRSRKNIHPWFPSQKHMANDSSDGFLPYMRSIFSWFFSIVELRQIRSHIDVLFPLVGGTQLSIINLFGLFSVISFFSLISRGSRLAMTSHVTPVTSWVHECSCCSLGCNQRLQFSFCNPP